MSITHTTSIKTSTSSGGSVSGQYTETGATEISIDENYPAASTDTLLTLTFAYANLQNIELVASQNMTIETNNGTTPDNTIALKANNPFVWSKSGAYFANPFTANVTAFYVTCTPAATLKGRILVS